MEETEKKFYIEQLDVDNIPGRNDGEKMKVLKEMAEDAISEKGLALNSPEPYMTKDGSGEKHIFLLFTVEGEERKEACDDRPIPGGPYDSIIWLPGGTEKYVDFNEKEVDRELSQLCDTLDNLFPTEYFFGYDELMTEEKGYLEGEKIVA